MDPADVAADIDLDDIAYLNWGASGPSPDRVLAAARDEQRRHERHAHSTADPYEYAAEQFAATRESVAGLLDTASERIALTDSTADGISRVANAIDWADGDTVVRTDMDHPAGTLPWGRRQDDGLVVHELDCPGGHLDFDALRDAAQGSKLVVLNAISWLHGTHLDISRAVDIAHDAGALVLVDAVQSPGQAPLPVETWGADFVAAAGHKWLAGVWGAGFLYVRDPERWRPRHFGYYAAFDYDDARVDYMPGAQRFEVGTNSLAPYAALREAIDIHHEVGLDVIRERQRGLVERLQDAVGERRISPREPESGLVTFAVDDDEAFVERAREAGVVVRSVPRDGWVRASVHAFNTEDDVERLGELL
ncbi:aminotransferase class V-fold PLP-dependent enzyme [Haloglomus litoreum]|uniref:aminotransferase class V-fold PLP-dependent enzyme n=1 Tax=Haloglomus litoreum TaxID=3034026 RepID=UPI0023E7749A|nr:aminotransferase class V-fold PLP-dependent enzyme [Haloglomus sp. DT116]